MNGTLCCCLLASLLSALPVSAQRITLVLTGGGSYNQPVQTYEPNPDDSPPDPNDPYRIQIGQISVDSGTANVTLAFAGKVAMFDTVASSPTNNTCQTNGKPTISIPVTTKATALYACFVNLPTGPPLPIGILRFLISASATGFPIETGALSVTFFGVPSLTVSPEDALDITNAGKSASVTSSAPGGISSYQPVSYASNSPTGWLIETGLCGQPGYTRSCSPSFSLNPAVAVAAEGHYTAYVGFSDSNDSVGSVTVTYMPPASAPGSVGLQPTALNFRPQQSGILSSWRTLALTNTSASPVVLSNISIEGQDPSDFVQTNNCPPNLVKFASCTISVSFLPLSAGSRSAALMIVDNATGAPQMVPLHGTGVTGSNSFAIWRPADGTWYVLDANATGQYPASSIQQQWGLAGDMPVAADYDGDGYTDFAVWRPSNGTWYVLYRSAVSSYPVPSIEQQWGLPGDIPVPGDYDGDGKADLAVWRPSNGTWFVIPSSNPESPIVQQWGLISDKPIVGDFDGDGKTDFAVWRPSDGIWYVLFSGAVAQYPTPSFQQLWGTSGDIPVSGDFNNDGAWDFAVWRPADGSWYVLYTTAVSEYPNASVWQQWGLAGDSPLVTEFNADGRIDFTVWRSSTATWYALFSNAVSQYPAPSVVQQWGVPSDVALPFR